VVLANGKRNDQMLEVLPIGLIAFPGSGITENPVDKARRIGILVWRFTADAGARAPFSKLVRTKRLWAASCQAVSDSRRCVRVGLCEQSGRRPRRGQIQDRQDPVDAFDDYIELSMGSGRVYRLSRLIFQNVRAAHILNLTGDDCGGIDMIFNLADDP